MKYFIFSDIHGNFEALEAVMKELDNEMKDKECKAVCLGDIVGYGPDPKACIEEIRSRGIFSLAGNHDYAVMGKMDISYFNAYAKDVVHWTKSVLDKEDLEFLDKLNTRLIEEPFTTFVHATPCEPEQWNYLFTLYDAQSNFKCFNTRTCFIGHSHQPMFIIQKETGDCWVHAHPIAWIRDDFRYIINTGSVGQPRDGNPAACFSIFDTDQLTVEIKRVEYDYKTTQSKMRKLKLPDYLIDRLEEGR